MSADRQQICAPINAFVADLWNCDMRLGLDMSAVASITDSLLDFESSIEASMEASMLLGREINTIGSKANHAEIQKLVIQMTLL